MKLFGFLLISLFISCVPTTETGSDREMLLDENVTNPGGSDSTDDDTNINSTPIRPNGQVSLDDDYCLCKEGLPFMFASGTICDNTCANHTGSTPVLAGSTTLGEQLTLDADVFQGKLVNWCSALLSVDDKNASCTGFLREKFATSSGAFRSFPITIGEANDYELELQDLKENSIYEFKIRAKSDITEAFSDVIQFEVRDNSTPEDFGDLLKISAAKRYYCLVFTGTSVNERDHDFLIHFMFRDDPPLIPNGVTQFLCHDENQGMPDNITFPRLGEENAFNLWDKVDRRFFVNNPNDPDNTSNEIDINLFVKKRLKEKFNQTLTTVGLFHELVSRTYPGVNNDSQAQIVGFKLQSFEDPDDADFPICPSEVDLNRPSSDTNFNTLFNVLSEFIGETEALYAALRTPREIDPISGSIVDDRMFINQTTLEKIWFYRDSNNQPTYLDPNDANKKSILKDETMY